MADFFSEIPVLTYVSVKEFIQLSVEWIKGMERSRIFRDTSAGQAPEFDGDYVSLGLAGGEFLEIRRIAREDGSFSVGFRYDLPDREGRTWRTEAVLSNNKVDAFLTVRVSCKTTEEGVTTQLPNRPYFLKLVLKAGWGGEDGILEVSDIPRYIGDGEVEIAKKCVLGEASLLLPVIYLSAGADNGTIVDARRLAYDLGGVAHVVVEPSREFSHSLREVASPNNPYGGAIGVALPGKPNVVRVTPYLDNKQVDVERLREQLIGLLASRLTRFGTDWYALQEEAAKAVRLRLSDHKALDEDTLFDEWSQSFNSEIEAKNDEIRELRRSIDLLQNQKLTNVSSKHTILDEQSLDREMPQLYRGEIVDRLLCLISEAASNPAGTFSERDVFVFGKLVSLLPNESGLDDLHKRLKTAGSDPKSASKKVGLILKELGYSQSDSGPHLKFAPPNHIVGIAQLTLAKTPSDHRAGRNMVRDARKALGSQLSANSRGRSASLP